MSKTVTFRSVLGKSLSVLVSCMVMFGQAFADNIPQLRLGDNNGVSYDFTVLHTGFLPPPTFKDIISFDEMPATGKSAASVHNRSQNEDSWAANNLRRIDHIPFGPYSASRFGEQAGDVGYEYAAILGGMSILGATKWKWGTKSFHTKNEGWFGKDTYALGMDKLGHAYTTYFLTEYFTQRIAHENSDPTGAAITGAILGLSLQSYIEVLDGFSTDHGFSYEDMVMNATGAAFSVLRSSSPEIASKIDFRRLYWPSGNLDRKFAPISDYTGQKYVLALKLAGFEAFEDTPLRFVELHGGYFARGFTPAEIDRGEKIRRELYFGVGVNLTELLQVAPTRDTIPSLLLENISRYHQLPYTYVGSDL